MKQQAIGLHVRLNKGLLDIISIVQDLSLPVVQSFLMDETGAYVSCSSKILHDFFLQKEKLKFLYFVHAAYWSNLVYNKSKEFLTLSQETAYANDAGADGIVIHVGAFRNKINKQDQVRFVADSVNELLQKVSNITLLLENGPHAGRNFGGDLHDFGLLKEHIEVKNRVKFCLDTAHAFVFGYELTNPMHLTNFFQLIQDVIGKEHLGLLHLNDADKHCASYIDKHGIIGRGHLKEAVLKQVLNNPLFDSIPVILELPGSCLLEDEKASLKLVESWIV